MLRGKTAKGEEGVKTKPKDLLPKMLPGSVCAQMIRCGKSNCKCARGQLHGPYYYHFERVGGCLRKRYLKPHEVEAFKAACQARREAERANRIETRQAHQSVRELIARLRQIQRDLI
jgi:hypothetical protein